MIDLSLIFEDKKTAVLHLKTSNKRVASRGSLMGWGIRSAEGERTYYHTSAREQPHVIDMVKFTYKKSVMIELFRELINYDIVGVVNHKWYEHSMSALFRSLDENEIEEIFGEDTSIVDALNQLPSLVSVPAMHGIRKAIFQAPNSDYGLDLKETLRVLNTLTTTASLSGENLDWQMKDELDLACDVENDNSIFTRRTYMLNKLMLECSDGGF